jgi:hypothetical protein
MFLRVTRLAQVFRERVLSVALLPVFFLGTLPHTACICADGHREEHCQALACRNLATKQLKTQKCGCCRDRAANVGAQSCCLAKQSQAESCTRMVGMSGSCCNPIVEAPAPMASAGKVDLATKSLVVATTEPPSTFNLVDRVQSATESINLSTPPPLDVVIVYLHLTI